jgi:DDE_Tnp_1-associated
LTDVPDPRVHRGRQHSLVDVLAVAAAAVMAGARSVTAIDKAYTPACRLVVPGSCDSRLVRLGLGPLDALVVLVVI